MSEQKNIISKNSSITKNKISALGFDQSKTILGVSRAQWKEADGDQWQDVGSKSMIIHYKDLKRKNYFIGVYSEIKRRIVSELAVTANTELEEENDFFISLYNPDDQITIGLEFSDEDERIFLGKILKDRIKKRFKVASHKGQKSKRTSCQQTSDKEEPRRDFPRTRRGARERSPRSPKRIDYMNLETIRENMQDIELSRKPAETEENVYETGSEGEECPPVPIHKPPPPQSPIPAPKMTKSSTLKSPKPKRLMLEPEIEPDIGPPPPRPPKPNHLLTPRSPLTVRADTFARQPGGRGASKAVPQPVLTVSKPKCSVSSAKSGLTSGSLGQGKIPSPPPPPPPPPPLPPSSSEDVVYQLAEPRSSSKSDTSSRAKLMKDIQVGAGRNKLKRVSEHPKAPGKIIDNHMGAVLLQRMSTLSQANHPISSGSDSESGSESEWD